MPAHTPLAPDVTGRLVALCLTLAAAGCARQEAAPAAAEPGSATTPQSAPIEALPRDGLTMAERAQWRAQIGWPDDCEDAFDASHAGAGAGIAFSELGPGGTLVEVTCAAGGYQPSTLRYKLVDGPRGGRAVPLAFATYTSEDGRELTAATATEMWGEALVDRAAGELAILSLARQTADCGVWARYSLAGDQPRLLAAAARVRCPAPPGPAARLALEGPPAGWDPIPRKD